MKINFFKLTLKFMVMALIAGTLFTSCKKDDDDDDDPVIVLDGLYLKPDGATDADLISEVKFSTAKNEVVQEERAELYEIYMALEAGSAGFNIVQVAGSEIMTYGPSSDFAEVAAEDLDPEEPTLGLWKGSYEETTNMFTVPEDALYHIAIDTELGKVAIAKVVWGLIGGATPGGWGSNTAMTATFDTDKMEFVVEDVTMLENEYKFRYSDGWKIVLDTELDLGEGNTGVKVNCNFGGSLTSLEAGGDNIANSEYAVYKSTMTWEKGVGHSATMEKTGEAEPLPEYYENLYMIGGSLNQEDSDSDGTPDGWQWDLTDVQMIPVHSNAHLFWRIVYLEAAGGGIKIAPVQEWGQDFGKTGDATDGVFATGSDNIPVDADGYYMVVVNLLDETVEVSDPLVYGMGDAFGTWDFASAATLFTVDNMGLTITSPVFSADGDLRIYVTANTLTNTDGDPVDWWQAEFITVDGVIEYRGTGDDQARLAVTTGQSIVLDFVNGTGTLN